MTSRANDTLPVLALFAPAFTPATCPRVQLLVVAGILTPGRRPITNLLRLVGHWAQGSASSYHRVLSQAQWSGLRLGPADALPRPPLLALRTDYRDRRRYRGRASRQEGRRHGTPPRPDPLQHELHRLPLRPQVGRADHPGALALRTATVGLARAGRPGPLHGRPSETPPPPQDPGATTATAAAE